VIFNGWGGDAADCGGAHSCSIAITQNKTAIAQLSAPTATAQITSSASYLDPSFGTDGAVIWVVEVQNPTSQTIESAEVNFTSHDAAGNVLASDLTFVGPIPPGETRASKGLADYLGTEASVDIQLGEVRLATEPPNFAAADIVSNNWRPDPGFGTDGAIIWTVEVQNTTAAPLESVGIDFVTYDANGKIITVDFTFVGPIPAGEKRSSDGLADLHGNEASVKFQIGSVR
jgi:hypothetical protein